MKRRMILFTDIGDTIIDEGTEIRDAPGGVVRSAECLPGAREVLLSLHDSGYTIAMVADGLEESFRNMMAQHGLDQVFAARVISETVGAEKPDPRMFRAAMAQLKLHKRDKRRILMLGNNLARDIAGGNAFGLRTALIRWSPRYRYDWTCEAERPDYVLDSPWELPMLLAHLETEASL